MPCTLTKSEIFDILHTSDSNLKDWWNNWLLLLFLRLFRCHSNYLSWIFNHLAIIYPNLLMFWQLSFLSHPFITQGLRQTRESVGKEVSQHAFRAHRNAEWNRMKSMQINMFDSLLLTCKPEWIQPEAIWTEWENSWEDCGWLTKREIFSEAFS